METIAQRLAARAHVPCAIVLLALSCVPTANPAAAPAEGPLLERLTIIAPSAQGGGYDLTAQAMKRVLERARLVATVNVTRSPGAGGLLGLTELVAAHAEDGAVLLVGGSATIGASASNRAAISLLDTTPIARLTGEYDVIAVSAELPYHTLEELLESLRRVPSSIRWIGGSSGGMDELLMRQLARAAGIDPLSLSYTPLPGGSEIVAQLRRGSLVAAVSGVIELESLIQGGRLRGLAVSAPQRLAGLDIPTFEELGIAGLSLMNWRGVFAAPGIAENDRDKLAAAMQRMARSAAWKAELTRHHWEDAYLGAPTFTRFVVQQHENARSIALASESFAARPPARTLRRSFWWVLPPALAVLALVLALYRQRRRGARREAQLRRALQEVSQDAERRSQAMQGLLAGVSGHIEREFGRWELTGAERGVANLMLKGLPLKEIAVVRNTSERTVRQQAQAIYRKAGLGGRSDLAAYFLEEFLAPLEPPAPLSDPLPGAPLARMPLAATHQIAPRA